MRNILSILVAAAMLPAQAAVTFDELDFSKVKKDASGKIVFVPIRNTTNNSGVFWYSDLQQKLINPVKINQSQRKITLRAFPASHENGSYNSFVSTHNLLDQRVNLLPTNAVLCEASSGLKAKLTALNFTYTVKPTVGSYPGLCWLELKYFATAPSPAETELVNYIQQNQVLNISYRITTPATPAVMMDVPTLVSQLEAANLLKLTPTPNPEPSNSGEEPTPAPVYQGELYPVLFASSHYATDLYRSDLSINDALIYADWYRFLTLFHVNVDNKITLDPIVAGQKLEVVAEIPGGTVTELQLGDTP
jgi:hypothetical protein